MSTTAPAMPKRVELCQRNRDNHPCLGVIFRPKPNLIYCPACGGTESGVFYIREGSEQSAVVES